MGRIIASHQAFGATLGGLIAAGAALLDRSTALGCAALAAALVLCVAKLVHARRQKAADI
jgi:hypothetical protein